MSYWVQQGYGKGTYIDDLVASGPVGGVVLSPGDETKSQLATTVAGLGAAVKPLLDPQTYIWGVPDAQASKHSDNGIAFPGLTWTMGAKQQQRIVDSVLKLNSDLGIDTVIAPSVMMPGIDSYWTGQAMQLAETTIATSKSPVLVSLVLDQSAFSDWNMVSEWLDVLTEFDVEGFYLLVGRHSRDYPLPWDTALYANVLRLIYRLSVLNKYRVLVGYTDIDGLAATAAGATGVASGWFFTLRQFNPQKWIPQGGGTPMTPRVLAAPLVAPLKGEPEASLIAASDRGPEVFPDKELRTLLADGSTTWGITHAKAQHGPALRDLIVEVEAETKVSKRCSSLISRLRSARASLDDLSDSVVPLQSQYRSSLLVLETSLETLVQAEGLS